MLRTRCNERQNFRVQSPSFDIVEMFFTFKALPRPCGALFLRLPFKDMLWVPDCVF